jgi:hypothetical protein
MTLATAEKLKVDSRAAMAAALSVSAMVIPTEDTAVVEVALTQADEEAEEEEVELVAFREESSLELLASWRARPGSG